MAYPPATQDTDAADGTPAPTVHAGRHNATAAAINAIVAELGAGPKGASADLTTRLAALGSGPFDAAGAAAAAQAFAIARANHTGTQAESTVTNLVADLAAKETPAGAQAKADAAQGAAMAASQPVDSDLTAIAALTTTTYGRAFLALVDAPAARTALALGAAALLAVGTTTGTVAAGDDSRFTNARTPTAHAASHAPAGSDDLTTALSAVSVPKALGVTAAVGTGTGFSRAGHIHPDTGLHQRPLMPAGALAETQPRMSQLWANNGLLSSGRLSLTAVYLPIGLPVSSITYQSRTTAAVTPTNQWFGLFDLGLVPLRLTADDTTTAWGANFSKTLALSSSFTTTYDGLYFLGIMVAAATVPTISSFTSATIALGLAPVLNGTSSTGLTTPATCPNPAGAITAQPTIPYAFLS